MNCCSRTAATFLLGAATLSVSAQNTGGTIYKAKCQVCHGPDGAAATPIGKVLKIPSFKTPEGMKASDTSYIAITRDGKGKMPAYSSKLSDAQIKEVISFVRTLQK